MNGSRRRNRISKSSTRKHSVFICIKNKSKLKNFYISIKQELTPSKDNLITTVPGTVKNKFIKDRPRDEVHFSFHEDIF